MVGGRTKATGPRGVGSGDRGRYKRLNNLIVIFRGCAQRHDSLTE